MVASDGMWVFEPSHHGHPWAKKSHGLRNEMPYLAESASQARPKKNTRGTKEALMRLR
jgi:hypothetical protein